MSYKCDKCGCTCEDDEECCGSEEKEENKEESGDLEEEFKNE